MEIDMENVVNYSNNHVLENPFDNALHSARFVCMNLADYD